jgi:tetratricopeptide (TPR) repeat protein
MRTAPIDTIAARLKNHSMNALPFVAIGIAAVTSLACASASSRLAVDLLNPVANQPFTSGLHHLYGFNYAAAESAFRQASQLDPLSPLPHWGLAMALGPNTNAPEISDEQMQNAYAAAQRARALSAGASTRTQALVSAIGTRYAASPPFDQHKLAVAYSASMRAAFKQFPNDSDIATLLVESLMLAREGPAWTAGGQPHADTADGLRMLEAVLARDPLHLGANHYHLHLLDGSPTPARGLTTARRLEQLGAGAGHLLHMPSHIYMRVGNYRAAVATNRKAVAADHIHGPGHGIYEVLQIHSREYLSATASMTGQFKVAWEADPSLFVMMRFNRWDDILARQVPEGGIGELEARIARVLALAGQRELVGAKNAFSEYEKVERSLPANEQRWWGQPIEPFLAMVRNEMLARITWLEGDRALAIRSWRLAVAAQDSLPRAEGLLPWFHPLRESLGAALYLDGQHSEAEAIFREDLRLNPNNPRALFGLMKALEPQGKQREAQVLKDVFQDSWQDADVELRMDGL